MNEIELRQHLCERGVPEHIHESIIAYVMVGQPVGSFLTAVFENNLMEAFKCADDMNLDAMHNIVRFIYEDVPSTCHGSPEKVKKWIEIGGVKGKVE